MVEEAWGHKHASLLHFTMIKSFVVQVLIIFCLVGVTEIRKKSLSSRIHPRLRIKKFFFYIFYLKSGHYLNAFAQYWKQPILSDSGDQASNGRLVGRTLVS
jgi:hypothetical protein